MHALVTGVSAGAGLLLGGELEIVVERLGERRPFDRPWWRCPSCAMPYRGRGLVPVANAVFLRRGCHSCRERVSHPWRPVLLGVLSAIVLGAFAARIGDDVALAAYAVFGLSMVAMSAVDFERQIIPNRLVYSTLALMVPLFVVSSAVDDRWGSLARAAIAGAAAFVAFLVVHLAVPRGMGFGDVRLAGVIGIATGWLGLGHAFVGFFFAFVLGALVGVVAMVVSGAGRKTRIPFGPFLAAGAVVTVLWGSPVAHALFHHTV
jgi:leader peptidase (prepilin peptidase) / N-methyltransferase